MPAFCCIRRLPEPDVKVLIRRFLGSFGGKASVADDNICCAVAVTRP